MERIAKREGKSEGERNESTTFVADFCCPFPASLHSLCCLLPSLGLAFSPSSPCFDPLLLHRSWHCLLRAFTPPCFSFPCSRLPSPCLPPSILWPGFAPALLPWLKIGTGKAARVTQLKEKRGKTTLQKQARTIAPCFPLLCPFLIAFGCRCCPSSAFLLSLSVPFLRVLILRVLSFPFPWLSVLCCLARLPGAALPRLRHPLSPCPSAWRALASNTTLWWYRRLFPRLASRARCAAWPCLGQRPDRSRRPGFAAGPGKAAGPGVRGHGGLPFLFFFF